MTTPSYALARAQTIAAAFGALPRVRAVALAGSITAATADAYSDLDIYVYHTVPIPHAQRAALAAEYAGADHPSIELDKPYWGPEDAWIDAASGLGVDLIYWAPDWIEAQIERVIIQHHAQVGYSTAFWYTILHSTPLFDRTGWFAELQERAQQPYPAPLRDNVLRMNYPLMRQSGSSYYHQIELAMLRQDRVSINHRVAALLASYFDIVFAVNQQPQPGEKRLIALATQLCTSLPEAMASDIDALLCATADPWAAHTTLHHLDTLLDHLDTWLIDQHMLTPAGTLG